VGFAYSNTQICHLKTSNSRAGRTERGFAYSNTQICHLKTSKLPGATPQTRQGGSSRDQALAGSALANGVRAPEPPQARHWRVAHTSCRLQSKTARSALSRRSGHVQI